MKLLDLLLKNGAEINAVDNNGESVLHEAAQLYAGGGMTQKLTNTKCN